MHAKQLIFEDCTYVNVDFFLLEQSMKKVLAYNSWISSKWRVQSELRYHGIIKMAKSTRFFLSKGKIT